MTNNNGYKIKCDLTEEAKKHLTVIGAQYSYYDYENSSASAEDRIYSLIALDNLTGKVVYLNGYMPYTELREKYKKPAITDVDLSVYVKMMERYDAFRVIMYNGGFELDTVTFDEDDADKSNPQFWTTRYSYKNLTEPEHMTDYLAPTCNRFFASYSLFADDYYEQHYRKELDKGMAESKAYTTQPVVPDFL